MHTKNNRRIKIILIAVVSIAAAAVCLFAVLFIRLWTKPQVKLARAVMNTLESSQESGMNREFGTYDMMRSIATGNIRLEYTDSPASESKTEESEEDEDSDGTALSRFEFRRDAEEHLFLTEADMNDLKLGLYVNKKNSVIYVDDMSMEIQYADNLITNLSNSPIATVMGIDSDTVYEVGQAYESCMRLAANSYVDDEGQYIDEDIVVRTAEYFLGMEGSSEGKAKLDIHGEKTECRLYSVTFDPADFNSYLDDCFGTHEIEPQVLYDIIGKYLPTISYIDNTVEMLHSIKQLVDDITQGEDIQIYFAVNNSGELIKLYADGVSEKNINISAEFYGQDYICRCWGISIGDAAGRELMLSKSETDSGDDMEVRIALEYSDGLTDSLTGEISVMLSDSSADIEVSMGSFSVHRQAELSDYKYGKYIELVWNGENMGGLHIGCDAGNIDKPECSESIDVLEADIFSLYGFISRLMEKL